MVDAICIDVGQGGNLVRGTPGTWGVSGKDRLKRVSVRVRLSGRMISTFTVSNTSSQSLYSQDVSLHNTPSFKSEKYIEY